MGNVVITDKADGTGINVTLTGLSGTGQLFVAGFSSNLANRVFTSVRSFNANGTYSISLQNGPYFAIYADSLGYQAPLSFRVSDGTLGLHERCLQGIREFILGMALPGVPTDPNSHKTHKKPVRSRQEFGSPLEGLHYWKAAESLSPSTNRSQVVTYPIEMVYLKNNEGDNRSSDDWTQLRELIGRSFPGCPLADIDEVYEVRVRPGVLYGQFDSAINIDVQSLIFECFTEQKTVYDG